MFYRKLRISPTFLPDPQELISFAWRTLLVTVSICGVVALLWSHHAFLERISCKAEANVSLAQALENDTIETSSMLRGALLGSIVQRTAPNYCRATSCNAISCSFIPRDSDPGATASNFINNDFKIQCEKAASVKLSFDNCEFPRNALRRNWLLAKLSIEELAFNSCSLSEIENDAFSSSIYKQTRGITMVNNTLVALRRSMFGGLEKLQYLTIRQNIIKSAELNLLEDLADSLTNLELNGAIDDCQVLRNITGGNVLPNLQLLSVQGNFISSIDAQLFVGVPSVKSLYLDNSKIKTVSHDALEPMVSSIWQIMLNNNNIVTLPQRLLDLILLVASDRPFQMHIHNNPWHCDCNLKWIQDLVKSRPNIMNRVPVCRTPPMNSGKAFTEAEFCYQSNSTVSTISVSSLESTNHDSNPTSQNTTQIPITTQGLVNVHCNPVYRSLRTVKSRKMLSVDSLRFRSRFPDFYVSESPNDQGILVNLPDLDQGVTLLWFNNDLLNSPSCVENVKHSYLLRDIDPQTAYTICLLEDNEDTVSPLNCLAVTTSPSYQLRTWLTNGDKSVVLMLAVLTLVPLFLIGAFLSFLLIRRYPTLLRGNKRVMLVKHRNLDAIVFPKGVDVDHGSREDDHEACYASRTHEDGYITPLPPRRSLHPQRTDSSRISVQSDRNSYVSQIETAESRLTSWAVTGLKNELQERKSVAPPLPPHPSDAIPSLSLAVDSNDDRDYQAFTV